MLHYIILNLKSSKLLTSHMQTFHTGQTAPAPGTYTFAGHMESSTCYPTEEEKKYH
jgi:hypothetical protein